MGIHIGLDWGGTSHAVCAVDDCGSIQTRFEARHDHAGLTHLGRKARFRNGHAVLDENLRQIEVRAEFEGHRDRHVAIRR